MTKIMLVEDDKSLREIYGVRLLAEGYDIVSAGDGEEALAMAIKERPALIITDVMMPRISGFDMLDILRSTTETRNIKVIMMTALSSEDQRRHGEQLGADRYLVKSQVGIEDVVRVVHEVLNDKPGASAPAIAASGTPSAPTNPVSAATIPTTPRTMASQPPRALQQPNEQANQANPTQSTPAPTTPSATPQPPTAPPASAVHGTPMPPVTSTSPSAPSTRQRVIQPINDPSSKVDINSLLDRELAREAGVDPSKQPIIPTTQQEKAAVQDQINTLVGATSSNPAPQPAPAAAQMPPAPKPTAPVPSIAIDDNGHMNAQRPTPTASRPNIAPAAAQSTGNNVNSATKSAPAPPQTSSTASPQTPPSRPPMQAPQRPSQPAAPAVTQPQPTPPRPPQPAGPPPTAPAA